jgi:hypothetical protein
MVKTTKAKGSRRAGAKAFYLQYKSQGRRLVNKVIRMKRHMKRHPNDNQTGDKL